MYAFCVYKKELLIAALLLKTCRVNNHKANKQEIDNLRVSANPPRDSPMPAQARFQSLFLTAIITFLSFVARPATAEILCDGEYGGHLQGLAVDGTKAIYWSFTTALVKTDWDGHVLKTVKVPSHHGDLTCHNGKIYCAVNLGKFNQEPGKADSWVYVFDAGDLSLLAKHKTPEVVHGAGGMEYHKGHFFIVGGLPKGYEENYVYEYDASFRFVKRHVIQSGYTLLGIQTVCFAHGSWWFGCYGKKLLRTDETFQLTGKGDLDFAVGLVGLANEKMLKGATFKENGRWRGKATVVAIPELERCPADGKASP